MQPYDKRERVRAFWSCVERWLKAYYWHACIVKNVGLWYREGVYLSGAFIVLVFTTWVALLWPSYRLIPACFAAYYIADSVLVNTWITFVNRSPVSGFRSVVLTLMNVANIGVAFAVLDASQAAYCFKDPLTVISAVYFSFATMMTIGYGDITPLCDPARLLVVCQVMVSLYFLAAVVTTVVQWAQEK